MQDISSNGHNICLLNDSFPPFIDGVANTVVNYARSIGKLGGKAIIATPECPGADDNEFPFPVARYRSIDAKKRTGYMLGVPFSPSLSSRLQKDRVELLHSHCPAMSTILARQLRESLNLPLVFTYHTKFEFDIANIVESRLLQKKAISLLVQNVSACDEVWAVSRGAGENLVSLGYEGDYIVMENGVDLEKGRVSPDAAESVLNGCDIPEDTPLYLFVGRMMWYKGIRIILDALSRMQAQNYKFRMAFVGSGADLEEIKRYAQRLGIYDRLIFPGAVSDRELLRAWYCRAELLVFPSSYDTNGLVVHEAAACYLPSVLIRGSCAAERVEDGINGYLIEECAESLAAKLIELYQRRESIRKTGEGAARDLYLSWDDAVARAYERYRVIIERHRSGAYPSAACFSKDFYAAAGRLMKNIGRAQAYIKDRYNL